MKLVPLNLGGKDMQVDMENLPPLPQKTAPLGEKPKFPFYGMPMLNIAGCSSCH